MTAVTICSDFGAQEKKVSRCFCCFPIYLPWSDGTGCHDLIFWMLNFKPAFSLSSFTFIKRLFSSSSLSGLRVSSSTYLRLLIFLPAILIPFCASFSLALHIIYSCILVKQARWQYTALSYSFTNFGPIHHSTSGSNCCFLTCIQVFQQAGKAIWYSHP